ncbi:MAG: M48 family metalloprotease [Candidatus Chromulinivorax sp.]|nr:M48 family metalloprotease [Candidatus Chromulinivorax sp.]
MKNMNLKLYAVFMLSLILIPHLICAEDDTTKSVPVMYAGLPDNYGMQALCNGGTALCVVGACAAYQYIVSNYLVQEEHLVKTDYPYAQLWYDELARKYPDAHLESKLFLQTMRGVPKKSVSWCSSFRHIYFPQDDLQSINYSYARKFLALDDYDEIDDLILAEQEFILLHEAGHIEHNDAAKRCMVFARMAVAAQIMEYGLQIYFQDPMSVYPSLADLEQAVAKRDFISNCNWSAKVMAIMVGCIYLSRTQECAADDFACEIADDQALKGGISFFESYKEADPLIDIEDATVSPFIPVDDAWGQKIQNYFAARDEQELQDMQEIKKNPDARWIFDFLTVMTHPGSSTRVQKIEDELDRRFIIELKNSEND